tara:strand:+ start:2265 stop:3326 length:1062 start_codon:yes stop_codon:yes gene_type:complete
MNLEQFEKLKEDYKDELVLQYCEYLDPFEIKEFHQRARANDNQQKNIMVWKARFVNGTDQKSPVSMRGDVDMEGISRGIGAQLAKEAMEKLGKNHPEYREIKLWTCRFMDEFLCFSDEQWEDWQDAGNDHLGGESNTDDDIKGAIRRRILSNRLPKIVKSENGGVPIKPEDNLKLYCDLAGKHLKSNLYKNSHRSWKFISNRVKECLEPGVTSAQDRKTWTTTELAKLYREDTGTDWEGKDFKDISSGEYVAVTNDLSRLDPNLGGQLLRNLRDSPGTKQTVLVALKSLEGLKDEDVHRRRASVVKYIERTLKEFRNPPDCWVKTVRQIPSDKFGVTTIWTNSSGQERLKIVN